MIGLAKVQHMVACVRASFVLAFLFLPGGTLFSQTLKYPKPPDPTNGKRIYNNGCIACHGNTGKGAPQTSTEFKRPDTFPNFTRCDQTTAEPNSAWKDVVVNGGPSRGFSQIMPAFGEVLTSEEINDVIAYMRSFCTNKHWPRGELNLPRALVTEKAYPEDEVVISTALNASGAPGFTIDIIHEQRFGVKNQIEVDVPINAMDQNHSWNSGLGDITFAVKRVSVLEPAYRIDLESARWSVGAHRQQQCAVSATEPRRSRHSLRSTNSSRRIPSYSSRWVPICLIARILLPSRFSGARQSGRHLSPTMA